MLSNRSNRIAMNLAPLPADVEDLLSSINSVKKGYANSKDPDTVHLINKLHEEITQLCRIREDEVKSVIRGAHNEE